MLKIQRSEEGETVVFALSGRIEQEHVCELKALLDGERAEAEKVLDLQEVRLVDREVVKFLADCEVRGITVRNSPSYVREWIEQGGYKS